MSDVSRRWLGLGVALLAAAGLTATELVDTPNEWGYLDPADFKGADVAAVQLDAHAGTAAAASGFGSADAEFTNPLRKGAADAPAEAHSVSRLKVDSEGHFVVTASATDFFDSYYRTYSSSSDEVVRGRILLALLDGLPPRAADEAMSALDEWRAARTASAE